jgi:O-succinylbenzoate synthase
VEEDTAPTLAERWASIGAGQTVGLLAIQLWQVELPFLRPVVTARGTHRHRPLVLVHVVATASGALVEGWGECAALTDTTYDAEDVTRALALLEHALVPALVDRAPVAGARLPRPSDLAVIRRAAPDATLAFAALEMAVADTHLRAEGRSLAQALGSTASQVPVGAVLGQFGTIDRLLSEVGPLIEAGYGRLKMKIGPGWDVGPVGAVRDRFPQLRLQADANGAYRRDQSDQLAALDPFGLLCIEQPLDPGDLEGHIDLAARVSTPICLDESVDSPRSVRVALDAGACSVVCVKPARLGGIGAAVEVMDHCVVHGVPMWIGGMFESGYARAVNATLASLPGFAWPGDLSPARSYLGDDLVAPSPLHPAETQAERAQAEGVGETEAEAHPVGNGGGAAMVSAPGPSRALVTDLPTGPGLGPPPMRHRLEQLVRHRVWVELPRP